MDDRHSSGNVEDGLRSSEMAATSMLQQYIADKFRCIIGDGGNLGEGGFRKVRFAFHDDWTNVALKCFPVMGCPQQKKLIIKQIKKEIEILQQTQNPHIVRVYGWAQWSYGMAIVMEYMPVGSLDNLIFDPYIELPQVLCLKFCWEISDGIAFIHNFIGRKRLVHGDLKPQNILVNSKLLCKIGDFGGAQVTKFTNSTTTTGNVVAIQHFTWLYAAPEYLDKTKPVRPRKEQDTYSFGLIVHGVLSREHPHHLYASTEDYLDAVKRGQRPDREKISELANELPNDEDKEVIAVLESVMERCWKHNPRDRANMVEVRDKLQSCLSNQGSDKIQESVEKIVNEIDVFSPSVNGDYSCMPLTHFEPKMGKFVQGQNMPTMMAEERDSSMVGNQRNVESNVGISLHAPVSNSMMNTHGQPSTSVPDSAPAMSERSYSTTTTNQRIEESHAGISLHAQPVSYAIVTGSKRHQSGEYYTVDFRVAASDKFCGKLLKILNEILCELGLYYFDPDNMSSISTLTLEPAHLFPGATASIWERCQNAALHSDPENGMSNWSDKYVEEHGGTRIWRESQNVCFKTNLFNRFSKIGWEKEGGNDVFDENGIIFRKKH